MRIMRRHSIAGATGVASGGTSGGASGVEGTGSGIGIGGGGMGGKGMGIDGSSVGMSGSGDGTEGVGGGGVRGVVNEQAYEGVSESMLRAMAHSSNTLKLRLASGQGLGGDNRARARSPLLPLPGTR